MLLAPLPTPTDGRRPGPATTTLLAAQLLSLIFLTGPKMLAAVTGTDERHFPAILREFGVARDHLNPGDLFASLFLHAGLLSGFLSVALHLLLLTILGGDLERRLGRPLFLALYTLGGAAGALISANLSWLDSPAPTLASTAALGALIGAHFSLFRDREIQVAYLAMTQPGMGRPRRWRPVGSEPVYADLPSLPARVILPICLILALLLSISTEARSAYLPGAFLGAATSMLRPQVQPVAEAVSQEPPSSRNLPTDPT